MRSRRAELFIVDLLEGGEMTTPGIAELLCPTIISRRGLSRAIRRLLLAGKIVRVRRGAYRITRGDILEATGRGIGLRYLPEEGTLVIQTPRGSVILRRGELPPGALEVLRAFCEGH